MRAFFFRKQTRFYSILVLLLSSLLLASCREEEKNSILVLSIEHLNSLENLCNKEKNSIRNSGFLELCPESIRFTHAYVSSTLTLPNLSTLMTGIYPHQHLVRHNGPPGLSPELTTVAEVALKNNFRTAFLSGGPPVFRKSGLHQGFEFFDESMKMTHRVFYSPLSIQVEKFTNWLDYEVKDQPFFAAFYVPDLQFKDTPKTNDLREAGSLGFDHQLEEVDESLFQLISTLKSKKRWQKTTIVITGLNGRPNPERSYAIQPINLHSENIQVSLLIKPSYKSQSTITQRTFDDPVSIADVGKTLMELVDPKMQKKSNDTDDYFHVKSLKPNLESTSHPWPGHRAIPIESGWLEGHKLGEIRSGVIINHQLIFFDEKPKYFNTLIDRLESRPTVFQNFNDKQISTPLQNLINIGYKPWRWPEKIPKSIFLIDQDLWWKSENEKQLLEKISEINNQKMDWNSLDSWGALLAMKNPQLKQANKFIKRLGSPSWSLESNPCYLLTQQKNIKFADRKTCKSKIFLQWLDWHYGDSKKNETEFMKSSFFRSIVQIDLKRKIEKMNWALALTWNDYSLSRPQLTELDWILTLPEFSKDRQLIARSLSLIEQQNLLDIEISPY